MRETEFRGWSLRKVADAVGVSPGALHKYIQRGYVSVFLSDPAISSLLITADGVRESILAAELLRLGEDDALLRKALAELRERSDQRLDLDDLQILVVGEDARFLGASELLKQFRYLLSSATETLFVLPLGNRHRQVMARLREKKPWGPEKA